MLQKKLKRKLRLLQLYWLHKSNFSFTKTATAQKEIIILFDGNVSHGGLVDRIKGILTFYNIAKIENASFLIYFESPFAITEYLLPNKFDWKTSKNNLQWNFKTTKIHYLMDNFDFNWQKEIKISKKKKHFVYCNVDYLPELFPQKNKEEINKLRQTSFKELFVKSSFLENALQNLNLPQKYIAIHTRFTSILGDFQDTCSHIVSQERKQEIIASLLDVITQISTQNTFVPIYVFSDSSTFLDSVSTTTPFKILEGKPTHIDVKNDKDIQNNLKTFIDFFAISQSEKVYLLQTPEMYNSAFSKYAALINNVAFTNTKV